MTSIFKDTMVTCNWQEVLKAGKDKIPVLFPFGVIEEHGPHISLIYGCMDGRVMRIFFWCLNRIIRWNGLRGKNRLRQDFWIFMPVLRNGCRAENRQGRLYLSDMPEIRQDMKL